MKKLILSVMAASMLVGLAACGGEDPDVRRGNLFYKNRQFFEASQSYEKAKARDPKIFENNPALLGQFKNAYYYYGGSLEISGSLEAALKYYEKGFALLPTDAAICDKLAKYYWGEEDFEKAAPYFQKLVVMDSEAPDTEQKWKVLGDDYYALGYCYSQMKQYPEAIEALQASLKASPKGQYAAQAKSALQAAQYEMKKKK